MEDEVKYSVEIMTFDGFVPRRITIPVDLSRVGEDFSARVHSMNSNDVKMWEVGSLDGPKHTEWALNREKELSERQKTFHPPMSHDDHETHIESY